MADSPDPPHVVWSGTFKLWGVEIRCHVLSDGERIIEAESLARLMEAMGQDVPTDEEELRRFARWEKGRDD